MGNGEQRFGSRRRGAGSDKVNLQDVSLSKYIDGSSPKLMLGCCIGTHYKDALLNDGSTGTAIPFAWDVAANSKE